MFKDINAAIEDYAASHTWYWYVPVWLFGLYVFIKLLSFSHIHMPFVIAVPYSFNFFLHEMAHIFASFLPEFFAVAAGSLSELLLGGLLVYGAFKTRTYFASLFCFLWLFLACQSVATYISDARTQQLPLVSLGGGLAGGEEIIHDWNFILGKFNLLEMDNIIAISVRFIGILAGIIGLIFSAWVIYKIATTSDRQKLSAGEAQLLSESSLTAISLNKATGDIYPEVKKGPLAESSTHKNNKQ